MNPVLMIIGEAPAALEDRSGRPFCGEAGELLTKIVGAMGIDRESQCYLTTIVKCRTPDESPPTPDAVGLCRPFLMKQIALVKPRFLLAMGQTAATVLAGSPSISRLRGRFLMHDDIPMLVTYHPAALLKEPGLKKLVWEDVKLIMARMKG
jgi:DNA polymerase